MANTMNDLITVLFNIRAPPADSIVEIVCVTRVMKR